VGPILDAGREGGCPEEPARPHRGETAGWTPGSARRILTAQPRASRVRPPAAGVRRRARALAMERKRHPELTDRYRGRKGIRMAFGHEKLDVYRAASEYVGWAYRFCVALAGHRNAKDQLLRASQAISIEHRRGKRKRDGRRPAPILRDGAWLGSGTLLGHAAVPLQLLARLPLCARGANGAALSRRAGRVAGFDTTGALCQQ
jgi:hypothetical protein